MPGRSGRCGRVPFGTGEGQSSGRAGRRFAGDLVDRYARGDRGAAEGLGQRRRGVAWQAYVPKNPSPLLQKFVVEEARSQLQGLFAEDPKPAKGKATAKSAAKAAPSKTTAGKDPLRNFFDLLQAFRGRTDEAAEEFLLGLFREAE